MKFISYSIVHHGADFLNYALASVLDVVDLALVVYSETPSHGQGTSLPNPETRDEVWHSLDKLKSTSGGTKIRWKQGIWHQEHEHRKAGVDWALELGADLILVLDADEVWERERLVRCLEFAAISGARNHLASFTHFWRSFAWTCNDPMMPVRILNMKQPAGTVDYLPDAGVLHFGYARKPEHVRYKASIHGHKPEWRANWFEEKFLPWPPVEDVHPTCVGFWTPERTCLELPNVLADHPYRDMEPIE